MNARLSLLRGVGIVLTASAMMVLTACGNEEQDDSPSEARRAPAAAKPTIVATTTQIAALVDRIADGRVELKVIMGPGVDPHLYHPSPADMDAIRRARVVLYNGLHLEEKMDKALEKILKGKSVAVTGEILPRRLIKTEVQAYDPHVWLDVQLWKVAAAAVGRELARIDPKGEQTYRENLRQLTRQMDHLDRYIRRQAEKIPKPRRRLVTSHDAFAYFGRAYGLKVRPIQGISTKTKARLKDVRGVAEYVVENKVPAVFIETSVPPKTIRDLMSDCKALGAKVRGGQGAGLELYSDAMGAPGERPGYAVDTYIDMMRYNIDTIVKGLAGEMKPAVKKKP